MTDSPQFSVVVPTRGRPDALRACLAALSRMHAPSGGIEIVVVADGADSRLGPVLAEVSGRAGAEIRLLTQAQAGPAAARNHGARHARGRLIAFTDDDCLPTPDWARRLVLELEREPDAIVGGRVVNALPSLPAAEASQLVVDVVQAHYASGAQIGAFLTSNNLALSRASFVGLRGFDDAFTSAAAEDRDLCERAAEAGHRIVRCDAVVEHSHALTASTLWRQHYQYGRGGRTLARRRAERGAPTPRPDVKLYGALVGAAWRHGRGGLISSRRMLALVALTQAAYVCGVLAGEPESPSPDPPT